MSDIIVAPETRDLDQLSRHLSHWLAGKLPGAQGLALANLAYPRGAGQSHETILFDAHWHEGGEARSLGGVVRIRPGRFTVFPDNLFREQYHVMRAMHESGRVRVAEPLWLEEDASILGAPFFVMRKLSGRVPVSIPPYAESGWVADATPAQRRRLWESGVRQLAAIQTVPTEGMDFLRGPAHARDGLAQEWDKYQRFVGWLEAEGASAGYVGILCAGMDRLAARWPANQPAGVVWGDARLGNMMFDDAFHVIAVMDWEQPSLGGALHDLAWFCELSETMHGARGARPHLPGMGTRAETVALWAEITGKPTDDLEWYEEFTRLKMSCTGVRLGLLRGHTQMDEATMARRLQVD